MSTYMEHPYDRFIAYDLFLSNEKSSHYIDPAYDSGTSISRLSEVLNLPVTVVREDILYLQKTVSYTLISADEEELERNFSEDIIFNVIDNWNSCSFTEKMDQTVRSGMLDELALVHYYEPTALSGTIFFPLTGDEQNALSLLNDNTFYNHIPEGEHIFQNYQVKNSYRYRLDHKMLLEHLNTARTAIQEGLSLSIVYRNSRGKLTQNVFRPLKIIYDSFENQYAILSKCPEYYLIYRFDRIRSLRPSQEQIDLEAPELSQIAPTVWGFCFSEAPTKVTVRFYNDSGVRIWDKVRRDLFYRTNGRLYEKDQFLYYEDEVRGLYSFRNWIYSYGASAEILEPLFLRESAILSYQKRLKRHAPGQDIECF